MAEGKPVQCVRCGFMESFDRMNKRLHRGLELLCRSCAATPKVQVRYGRTEYCSAWQGELDELWRPVDAYGNLVKPGKRSCGRSDCMRHVVAEEAAPAGIEWDFSDALFNDSIRMVEALSESRRG